MSIVLEAVDKKGTTHCFSKAKLSRYFKNGFGVAFEKEGHPVTIIDNIGDLPDLDGFPDLPQAILLKNCACDSDRIELWKLVDAV